MHLQTQARLSYVNYGNKLNLFYFSYFIILSISRSIQGEDNKVNMNANNPDPFLDSAQYRADCVDRTTSFKNKFTHEFNRSGQIRTKAKKIYQFRPLTKSEIQTLTGGQCRCKCSNWNSIRVLYQISHPDSQIQMLKDLSHILLKQYSDCMFSGFVILGVDINTIPADKMRNENSREDKLPHPLKHLESGVHRNLCIRDCILEPGCRIYGNGIIEKTHVSSMAFIVNCGTISRSHNGMGSMLDICVGPESGGERLIQVFPESTIVDACHTLMPSKKATFIPYRTNRVRYENAHFKVKKCPLNIVLSYSYIMNNPNTIQDIFLYEHSYIHSSCTVSKATLLPYASISSNSNVTNVCLQWRTSISQSAIVTNSLLMETSSVCNSAIVHSTILGPDVHLEGGETHHSLIGPSVNSHHQSLLIGVIWPLGRGNVGYGANVGSNHTGRIPDQECWSGEGLFWGLSCVIKFPINTLLAPYSIVAAGTILHPQCIEMPFSLLLDDGTIFPGWVLGHSPYTIARSEKKFVQRRKARRHLFYTGWKIMRPSIIQLCFIARNYLQSNDTNRKGIGKCKLTERARKDGILFYSHCIQRYALHGLLNQFLEKMVINSTSSMNFNMTLSSSLQSIPIPKKTSGEASNLLHTNTLMELPWEEASFSNPDLEWKYQYSLLEHEFPNTTSIFWLFKYLATLERDHTKRVTYSKSKDDFRGNKVIPGYAESHVLIKDDAVVKMVKEEENIVCSNIGKILRGEWSGLSNRSRL